MLLAGCHIGDCHYISGNKRAEERTAKLRRMLHTLGLEDERLKLGGSPLPREAGSLKRSRATSIS